MHCSFFENKCARGVQELSGFSVFNAEVEAAGVGNASKVLHPVPSNRTALIIRL